MKKNYQTEIEAIETMIQRSGGQASVAFYDFHSQDGFSIRGDDVLPSASLIKLLILTELMERVHEGVLSLGDRLSLPAASPPETVPAALAGQILPVLPTPGSDKTKAKNVAGRESAFPSARTGGDGILKELYGAHEFSLLELAVLMIVLSDNHATNLLIDHLGMESINLRAKKLHLNAAGLGRKMMDSEAKKRGSDNFLSANDVKRMLQYFYLGKMPCEEADGAPEDRSEICGLICDILGRQQQKERLQRYLPEELPVLHKCGDLELLEHDGGIILLPENPYLLVVMTHHLPENRIGRELIGKISRYLYDRMTSQP